MNAPVNCACGNRIYIRHSSIILGEKEWHHVECSDPTCWKGPECERLDKAIEMWNNIMNLHKEPKLKIEVPITSSYNEPRTHIFCKEPQLKDHWSNK